jgi:uncharacterized LabA/DUF88 family protein
MTEAAEVILAATFDEMAKGDEARLAEPDLTPGDLAALKERLASYETAIVEQQRDLQQEMQRKQSVERERSELLGRIARREQALRQEEALRRRCNAENAALAARVRALEGMAAADPSADRADREEAERLRAQVRTLEHRLEKASRRGEHLEARLLESRAEADERAGRIDALVHEVAALRTAERSGAADLSEARARVATLEEKLAACMEELRAGRHREAPPAAAATTPPRTGVYVDAANLSASARRDFGDKLDYRALLARVLDGRAKGVAVAFVVKDGDDASHHRFVRALRDGGYDVREKTPKRRADGSKKADWDMGIAMAILDAAAELDVVVLCSGDGDFVPLVKGLRKRHVRMEAAAFRGSTDEELVRAVDRFWPLDDELRLPP